MANASGADNKKPTKGFDITNIGEIGPCAALILAAELDRWQRIDKVKLSPSLGRPWKQEVFDFLMQLGLFQFLDTDSKEVKVFGKKIRQNKKNNPTSKRNKTLKLISADMEDTCKTSDFVINRIKNWLPEKYQNKINLIYDCISEATSNVGQHAYTKEERSNAIYQRWWATASLIGDASVRLLIFDQGMGIPASIRANWSFAELKKLRTFSLTPKINEHNAINEKGEMDRTLSDSECIKVLVIYAKDGKKISSVKKGGTK